MGMVAADRTGLFQGSQAAVAGRKAEADAPGNFGNGQRPSCCSSPTGGIPVKEFPPWEKSGTSAAIRPMKPAAG